MTVGKVRKDLTNSFKRDTVQNEIVYNTKIDKEKLNNRLSEWYYENQISIKEGNGEIRLYDDIGATIYDLVGKMCNMNNFKNYFNWKSDMKDEAVIACIVAAKRFKPIIDGKNVNAYSYIWAYAWRAILTVISKRKQEHETMEKYTRHIFSKVDIDETETLDYTSNSIN